MNAAPAPECASVPSRAGVRVLQADTPEQALKLAAGATLVAGATWLQPVWERQARWPARVVPLSAHWDGFCGITVAGERLQVGALTSLEDFARSPHVTERLPGIAAFVDRIAGPSVRHLGTVGGNLLAGGDLSALALVLDARLQLLADDGWSELPLEDWYQLPSAGLVRSVSLNIAPGSPLCLEKLGHREAFSPTRITLACTRTGGRQRVALCGEGGPRRLRDLENTLAMDATRSGPDVCAQALADLDWGDARLRQVGGELMAHLLGQLGA